MKRAELRRLRTGSEVLVLSGRGGRLVCVLDVLAIIVLIFSAAVWAGGVLALVSNLSGGWPRHPHFRWFGVAGLLILTGSLIAMFADYIGWPSHRLVSGLNFLFLLAATPFLVVGTLRRRADAAERDGGAARAVTRG